MLHPRISTVLVSFLLLISLADCDDFEELVDPFSISAAWAVHFDAEMGRDKTKKREITEEDLFDEEDDPSSLPEGAEFLVSPAKEVRKRNTGPFGIRHCGDYMEQNANIGGSHLQGMDGLLQDSSPSSLSTPTCLSQNTISSPNDLSHPSDYQSILAAGPEETSKKHLRREEPTYRISNADDNTNCLSVFHPITPYFLKNIFIPQNPFKIACFHAGLIPGTSRFDFHDRISVSSLQKIIIQLPENQDSSDAIPLNFLRLFHYLTQVDFDHLEHLRVICSTCTALRIPLMSAFVPTFEYEDFHPLIELIRKNKESLDTISIGPILREMYIKINPLTCSSECDPANFARIETFEGFPDYPILPSWSVMLRPQKHLTKLVVTLSHQEVWNDVTKAILHSSDSLKNMGIFLKAVGGECVILDLKMLRNCSRLAEFSIQYSDSHVIGWAFLPPTIKNLTIHGGHLTFPNTEAMAIALAQLEEVTIHLSPDVSAKMEVSEGRVKPTVDIVHHPSYQFIRAAPKTLKTFNIESEVALDWDWDALRTLCEDQHGFKLIEGSDHFSLVREIVPIPAPEFPNLDAKSESQEELDRSFFGPCFSLLDWRSRNV